MTVVDLSQGAPVTGRCRGFLAEREAPMRVVKVFCFGAVLVGTLVLAACGTPGWGLAPLEGDAAPPFNGAYELRVRTADRCALPVQDLSWQVVTSTTQSARGWQEVSVSLPGGPSRIMDFYYFTGAVEGHFETATPGLAVAGQPLRVEFSGRVFGTVTRAGAAGSLRDGTLAAHIRVLADDGAKPGLETLLATCEATDHTWSLVSAGTSSESE